MSMLDKDNIVINKITLSYAKNLNVRNYSNGNVVYLQYEKIRAHSLICIINTFCFFSH